MSPLLSCLSIGKSFGYQPLFSNISISFSQEERLGLIGPNGSGKSTLLKLLAGLDSPDEGEISMRRDSRIVYLSQEDRFDSEKSVEEVLLEELDTSELEESERYTVVKKWIARIKGVSAEQKTGTLSGGWKKRLAIARAFIQEPDMLLLDEPTNHLDIGGILWLEELLTLPPFAFILVSHDRYFLENVTQKTIELNRCFPDGYLSVNGNYSEYMYSREATLNSQLRLESALANKVRRETEWLRRGPKARTTKARFRIEEAYRLRDELSVTKTRNRQTRTVDIDFDATGRKTKRLLTVEHLSKAVAGTPLFTDVNLVLTPGCCLGLLGGNGTGKSTLIKVLDGELLPDSGEIKRVDGVKVVVFDQTREQLDQRETLREALSPAGDSVIFRGESVHVVTWARRFLFEKDQLDLPIHRLSGGEQARILIARLMTRPADILLLDEPTNDLDIPSLEILEESIRNFPGAVVLVTHDRFLLDRLTHQILGLDGKGGASLYADYNQWLDSHKSQKRKPSREKSKTGKPKTRKRLSYNEQKELAKIEETIQNAERELENCQRRLSEDEVIHSTVLMRDVCDQLKTCQEKVEGLYKRWEELEEKQG